MISAILGLLTGLAGPITNLTTRIVELKTARLKEENDVKKAEINQEIQENEARKSVLIAEAGNRIASTITASLRATITIGPALYVLKYYLYDKVIGSLYGCTGPSAAVNKACSTFRTDPLSTEMAAVLTAVLMFYFVTSWINKK